MSEFEKIMRKRRKSTDAGIISENISKIDKEATSPPSKKETFSKPNQQLTKKLSKRLEKEKFAESVAAFAGSSNLDVASETDIDKKLKKKKEAVAEHFDAPTNELNEKLRRRRQSIAGMKLEPEEKKPKSKNKEKKKKKKKAETEEIVSSDAATTTNEESKEAAIKTTTSRVGQVEDLTFQYMMLFVMAVLTAIAWYLLEDRSV